MVPAPNLRKLLSIAFVGALAACSSVDTPANRVVVVTPDVATTISLVPRNDQVLMVGNSAAPAAAAGVAQKTVEDAVLQAKLDAMAADGSFAAAIPSAPPGASQLIVLQHGDRQWYWAPGSTVEGRTAYLRTWTHFQALFNDAANYRPAGGDALRDTERRAGIRRKP
ncbi:MAG: hypothetical protein H6835_07560 [Planctomycetes bacterium]|nr:hypothetical protein [Planctomycetota bacterium]